LTAQEVDIIEWWIASGAPSSGFITELDSEKKITVTVNSYLGLDKNTVLSKQVSPANQLIIDSLVNHGFIVNRLMKSNYFLEANFSLSEKPISSAHIKLLISIKEQLIWLDLSNAQVSDESLEQIRLLENLIKLDLSGNDISDTGIQSLEKLIHLESLNLYNTSVSEGILEIIPKLTRLQKIYLWQTKVNDSLMRRIQSENQNLEVISMREREIE
jgi:Leucine-rich repeat (LRR) protein